MLRKFHVVKQIKKIKTCIKHLKLLTNFVSVRNAGSVSTSIIKINSFCKLCQRNSFFGKTFTVCTVSLLSSILYNSVEEDVETNLAHLMQLAKYALEAGEIERAEAILKVGLKLSEDHKVYTALPFIYDILATLAINEGRIDNAELLLVEAIERLSSLGYAETNHNIIDFRLRLARMYSSSGYTSLADIGFENCLDHQKKKIMDGDLTDKTGLYFFSFYYYFNFNLYRTPRTRASWNVCKN